MELDENSVLKGSGFSMIGVMGEKSYSRKWHTVTHVVLVDKEFLVNRMPPSAPSPFCIEGRKTENCRCLPQEIVSSAVFTATDDGEVNWKIVLTNPYTYRQFAENYQMRLNIVSKPEMVGVEFYAKVHEWKELAEPFGRKPNGEPYTRIQPGKTHALPAKYYEVKMDNIHNIRIDLTYRKFAKDENESTTSSLSGSNHSPPVPVTEHHNFMNCCNIRLSLVALLENPISSDVTVKADGREWRVHKCILAARSSVFAAMFSTDMKEETADSVEIKDVDSKSFDVMIKHIYGNEVAELDEEVAVSVMFLAKRFDVPELKCICQTNLLCYLRTGNCLAFYLAAEKCSATLLQTFAENLLVTDLDVVSKTDEWKDFVIKDFERSRRIMQSALSIRCEKLRVEGS